MFYVLPPIALFPIASRLSLFGSPEAKEIFKTAIARFEIILYKDLTVSKNLINTGMVQQSGVIVYFRH